MATFAPKFIKDLACQGDSGTADTENKSFFEQKLVWVWDGSRRFLQASVVASDGDKRKLLFQNGQESWEHKEVLYPVNPPKFHNANDMADLTFLNEPSVLHNLQTRYASNEIYTYSGLFLVSVNPYKELRIYNNDKMEHIQQARNLNQRPAHIFAVADQALCDMKENAESQSILVTGESGAGKTEATKKVIKYLAVISQSIADPRKQPNLEEKVLQANPILEAFGNAKTARNDNSSRFGKFIRLQFNSGGTISGASIDWYLLEKSRVTMQSAIERNYHIFYQMLAGVSDKDLTSLFLSRDPNHYVYLRNSKKTIESVDDKKDYRSLVESCHKMGIESNELQMVLKTIAIILHLGNLEFTSERSGQARLLNNDQVEKLCFLLGVAPTEFSRALLRPKSKAGNEWVTNSRSKDQVVHSVAALARTLYERLFGHIVSSINYHLRSTEMVESFIGILDIAGFEIFETNSFEQFCINYTNEKLQQYFNHHMFVLEQDEYEREGIDWHFIDFGRDLQPTIDLIERSNPIGIFSCLDEECVVPQATNVSFTDKVNKLCTNDVGSLRASKYIHEGFILKHYAADVEYHTDEWLEKNKDPLNTDLSSLLANSSDSTIASLFPEFQQSQSYRHGRASRVKGGIFRTVAQKHKEQLSQLMNQLNTTQPHFVRCLIPNHDKSAGKFDSKIVLDQLRCNGVLEGIRIARTGYPNRLPFYEFKSRYELLAPQESSRYTGGKDAVQQILVDLKFNTELYRLGKSKVFFRAGALASLEEEKEKVLSRLMMKFQARSRGFLTRRWCSKTLYRKESSVIIEKNLRVVNELSQSPWFHLYCTMRPLLGTLSENVQAEKSQSENLYLKKKMEESENETKKAQLTVSEIQSQLRKMELEMITERETISDKEEIHRRTQERVVDLEQEISFASEDIEALEQQCDTLVSGQKKLEGQIKLMKTQLIEGAQIISNLETEKSSLKRRLEDSESTVKTMRERSENKENIKAKDAQEDLKQLQAELRKERQTHSRQTEQLRHANTAKDDEIRKLNEKSEELQRELVKLQGLLGSKHTEFKNLEARKNVLESKEKEHVEKMRKVEVDNQKLRTSLRDAESNTQHTKAQLDISTNSVTEMRGRLQKLTQTESELARLRNELSSVSAQADEASRLQTELEGHRKDKEKLQEALGTSFRKARNLEIECDKQKERIAKLESQQARLDKLRASAESTGRQLETTNKELSKFKNESQKLSELRNADQRLLKQSTSRASTLEQENQRYQSELKAERQKVEEIRKIQNDLQSENEAQAQKCDRVERKAKESNDILASLHDIIRGRAGQSAQRGNIVDIFEDSLKEREESVKALRSLETKYENLREVLQEALANK